MCGDASALGRFSRIVIVISRRRLRFGLLLLVASVVASIGLASTAGAHSEVFERAPAVGQVVTGEVDHIDISFFAAIDDASIALLDPSGEPVEVGETVVADNQRITTVEFAPLVAEGRYTVVHEELSSDGDVQESAFSFIYSATEGEQVATLFAQDSGPNWLLLGGLALIILGVAGFFLPKQAKSRA